MKINSFEADFAAQVLRYRLPSCERNFKFALDVKRKWEIDFYWPAYKLGVELQGIKSAPCQGRTVDIGGHGTVVGRVRDMDKHNAAILFGIAILQFTQAHVACVDAIAMTQRALIVRGWGGRL